MDSAFDVSLAGVHLGEITSLATGGVLPSEINPEIMAFVSTSSLEKSYNLTVPNLVHAEVPDASLPCLSVEPYVVGKRSLHSRDGLFVPSYFQFPAASSRSTSQFSVGNAVRVPSKAGDTTMVHFFHVLAGSDGKSICGGKIGSSGLQACVADVLLGSTLFDSISCYQGETVCR